MKLHELELKWRKKKGNISKLILSQRGFTSEERIVMAGIFNDLFDGLLDDLESLNIESTGSDSAVAAVNGDYTNVSHRTAHGDTDKTAVESALPKRSEAKEDFLYCKYPHDTCKSQCKDCKTEQYWGHKNLID